MLAHHQQHNVLTCWSFLVLVRSDWVASQVLSCGVTPEGLLSISQN